MATKKTKGEVLPPLALSTTALLAGALYNVVGYHTGNFVGVFMRAIDKRFAEFKITQCKNADLNDTVVEVPHYLAQFTPSCSRAHAHEKRLQEERAAQELAAKQTAGVRK